MSLLFKKMAKHVAKILLSTAMLALLAVSVDAQKKRGGKVKPKPPTKSKKYQKPTGKSTPKTKVKKTYSPILPKILVLSPPLHRELHFTEESWTDAIASKFIVVSSRPNGGILFFRVMHDPKEENFSIKVDADTAYIVPVSGKNGDIEGCFMMVYCKVHETALIFSQVQCF